MNAVRSSSAGVDDHAVNEGGLVMNGANKDDTPRQTTSVPAGSVAAVINSGSVPAVMNYPDNQQVFIGNLPQHLTDDDLIEHFERMSVQLISTIPPSSHH